MFYNRLFYNQTRLKYHNKVRSNHDDNCSYIYRFHILSMSKSRSQWDPKHYNARFSFVYKYGEDLLALLDPKPGERILDLGCGTGELTDLIHQSGAEVIGLDKSKEMIAAAQRKFPLLEFVRSDAASFQFDPPFDAIFSNATLHWVLDHRNCIQSMYENLKAGGRLVLEFGGKGNIENIIQPLRTALSERGYSTQADLQLWYFPSLAAYSLELEDAGFHVTSAQDFDRPTKLEGDLKDWLSMFAQEFLIDIPEVDAAEIKKEVQERATATGYQDGIWYADYTRLRITAVKKL